MSTDNQKVIAQAREIGFRDGYMSALAQLQLNLTQVYAKKILGITDAAELPKLPEEDMRKIADADLKLGLLMVTIDNLRQGAMAIMRGEKPVAAAPANEEKTLDSGLVLG